MYGTVSTPGFGFNILALISNFIVDDQKSFITGYSHTDSVVLGNPLFCGGPLEFQVIWGAGGGVFLAPFSHPWNSNLKNIILVFPYDN